MMYLLLVAVLSLAGCFHTSYGNEDVKNKDLVAQVQMGKSTKDDVRKLFGAPTSVSKGKLPEARPGDAAYDITMDEWWVYFHGDIHHDPMGFIPVVGILFAKSTTDADHFVVGFDAKGVVRHITSGQQNVKSEGILSNKKLGEGGK